MNKEALRIARLVARAPRLRLNDEVTVADLRQQLLLGLQEIELPEDMETFLCADIDEYGILSILCTPATQDQARAFAGWAESMEAHYGGYVQDRGARGTAVASIEPPG